MTAPFQFYVSTRTMSPSERRRRHRIARAHDCQFVYMRTIPGYRSWFETPSKGEPFDSETRHAVIAALELAEGGAR